MAASQRALRNPDSLTVVHYVPGINYRIRPVPDLDPSEMLAFEFHMLRAAPDFLGSFRNEFWLHSMLLVAYHEPAVRHAVKPV